jgi:hypothetical protein
MVFRISPPPPLVLPQPDNTPSAAQRIITSLPPCKPYTIHHILAFCKAFQDHDEVNIVADEIDLEVEFLSRSFSWLERALDVDAYAGNMQGVPRGGNPPATVFALRTLLLRILAEDTKLLGVLRKLQYFGRKHRERFGAVGDEAARLIAVCERLLKVQKIEQEAKRSALEAEEERARDEWHVAQQAYLDAKAAAECAAAEAAAAAAQARRGGAASVVAHAAAPQGTRLHALTRFVSLAIHASVRRFLLFACLSCIIARAGAKQAEAARGYTGTVRQRHASAGTRCRNTPRVRLPGHYRALFL